MLDMLIAGGSVVSPAGVVQLDVGIKDGRIASLAGSAREGARMVVDASGCVVLPGGIDLHTHLRTPAGESGLFRRESASAVAGGVTTLGDFAYPPGTRFELEYEHKREQLEQESLCDFIVHTVVRSEEQLEQAATHTVKVFLASSGLGVQTGGGLELVCRGAAQGHLVLAHVEAMSDYVAIANYVARNPDLPGRVHILHVPHQRYSMAVASLADGRVTMETCPHYLLWEWSLNQVDCDVNPAVVPADLWPEIRAGRISTIGTDHCSYTRAEKAEFGLPGFPGVGASLRLLFTAGVKAGRISWAELCGLLSAGPARVLGLYPRKGAIQVGSDADLVLFDPQHQALLGAPRYGRGDFSPFSSLKVWGKVVGTWVRGRQVYGDGVMDEGAAGWGTWQEAIEV